MGDLTFANVVIYARYSSVGQNDQSIDGQLEKCREYAAQRGYRVVGEYCDRALSGRYAETRPEFQRMIADSAKKAFSFVLVWKLDRFSRDRYDSAIYKKRLRANGVRVLSITEGVDEGAESILLEAILEAMAEEYSRQLAQNVRRGMRQNAEKALSNGGLVPLGYRIVDKRYEIDETTAPIIRFIHTRYLHGDTAKQIADACLALGYRTQRGQPLCPNAVYRILHNERYAGIYRYGDVVLPDAVPAIISPEEKKQVLARLAANARAPARAKAKVEYLLHGKLFCGHCGAPMIGESGRGRHGTTYYYYTCAARKRDHTCKKRNERKDALEQYVVDHINQHILTDKWIADISERVAAEYAKIYNASGISAAERQLREADKELDALVDALIKTTAPAAIAKINERIEAAEAKKRALEDDLAHLRIAAKATITTADVVAWLNQFRGGDPLDLDYRKKIIDLFVNAIYIYDDHIKMFFNTHPAEQIAYPDVLALSPPAGSDLSLSGVPTRSKSEHIVLINGVIGICLAR